MFSIKCNQLEIYKKISRIKPSCLQRCGLMLLWPAWKACLLISIWVKQQNSLSMARKKTAIKLLRSVRLRPAGGGIGRWEALTRPLYDCRAVLVSDMGKSPKEVFKRAGIDPLTMSGFIEAGLDAVYSGKTLLPLKRRAKNSCSSAACLGTGTGCG